MKEDTEDNKSIVSFFIELSILLIMVWILGEFGILVTMILLGISGGIWFFIIKPWYARRKDKTRKEKVRP